MESSSGFNPRKQGVSSVQVLFLHQLDFTLYTALTICIETLLHLSLPTMMLIIAGDTWNCWSQLKNSVILMAASCCEPFFGGCKWQHWDFMQGSQICGHPTLERQLLSSWITLKISWQVGGSVSPARCNGCWSHFLPHQFEKLHCCEESQYILLTSRVEISCLPQFPFAKSKSFCLFCLVHAMLHGLQRRLRCARNFGPCFLCYPPTCTCIFAMKTIYIYT